MPAKKKFKTITVFGSAIPEEKDYEYTFAYNLGAALAKEGYNVCSGGYYGIMEAVSKGAGQQGAKVTGVTLKYLKMEPNKYLTEEIQCYSLFERILKLIELGDGFVVLQGGTGTLLELSALWEMLNKHLIIPVPVVCHSDMWFKVCEVMKEQLAKEKKPLNRIQNALHIDEIIKYLNYHLK